MSSLTAADLVATVDNPTAAGCTHCGLPLGPLPTPSATDPAFCCPGCRTAYAVIQTHGLGDYYTRAPGSQAPAGDARDRLRYADFDRLAFVEAYSTVAGPDLRTVTLAIDGMHCAACIWLLENLPRIVDGVLDARVHWRRATITVRWRPTAVALSTIAEAIADLGYRPYPQRIAAATPRTRHDERGQLIALAIAFAAAGNNMLIAGSLYLGDFAYMDPATVQLLRWASCAVGVVSLAWPGRPFFRGAWSALRTRTPHMDLPVALGLATGGIAGVLNTVRGHGALYFDTLSVLVFLLLVGRFIQTRQQRRAAAALDVLYRITPRVATRRVDGRWSPVPVEVLQPGDIVAVDEGETVPGDGTVLSGTSTLDTQVLTGESKPIPASPGTNVAAGSVNLTQRLQVRLDKVGDATRMGRVLTLVEDAAGNRPPIAALADRIAGVFVLVVIAVCVVTFAAWLHIQPERAVDNAVAVLIVACPCALGLATPLAIAVAVGRAARRSILIKGGDVLQRLSTPGTIWLDKTGTLTQGRMRVVDWCGATTVSGRSLLTAVAALEQHSAHPVGRALVQWADDHAPPTTAIAASRVELQSADRNGVTGTVDGVPIAIGNGAYVTAATKTALPSAIAQAGTTVVAQGWSPVFVAVGHRVLAVAGVGDPLRPDARDAVDTLVRRGWTVGILSGDHPDIVEQTGAALGLPPTRCHGAMSPEDKVERVSAPRSDDGPVVMVGDGINDAAALAAASVGIATRDGAEASLQAAAVYLAKPGLGGVVSLLDVSRVAMRGIKRNFAVSLAYNATTVGLAVAGIINPLLAAVLMPLSSLSVVGMSASIRLTDGAQ